MDELKTIFNEEQIDFATFEKRLAENSKTIKLANLRGGGYVDAAKYSQLEKDFNTYKEQNDVSKYADYDTVVQERDQLKAEKANAEMLQKVAGAKVAEPFREFVLEKVKGAIDSPDKFETALAEYVKANPQYLTAPEPKQSFFRGSTQLTQGGGAAAKKTTNDLMNNLLRGTKK